MIEIIPNYHPIFVHFTVALLSMAVAFYFASLVTTMTRWRYQWVIVARWSLWLGAGFAVVTVLFGFLAFNSVAHDTPSHAAMLEHRNWAFASLSVFIPLALWSWWKHGADKDINWRFVLPLVLASGILFVTAWHGGELVYRYGLGVMSLPKIKEHQHNMSLDSHSSSGIPIDTSNGEIMHQGHRKIEHTTPDMPEDVTENKVSNNGHDDGHNHTH